MNYLAYRVIQQGADKLLTRVGGEFEDEDEAKAAIIVDAAGRSPTTYQIDRVQSSVTYRATPQTSVDLEEQ